jgi:two-component system, chemotaxis family, chemotaxis protein CheY
MQKRILVVDDSNLMQHCITQCLTSAGYEVVGKAKNGNEAVDLYGQLLPDAVTMDVTMRGKDGIAAAREILQGHPGAAIIFYTLLDIPDLEDKAQALGVKSIVRKGDEAGLLQALSQLK